MKQKVFLMLALLLMASGVMAQKAPTVFVNNFTIGVGETKTISVNINNPNVDFHSFAFSLLLPEGVTIVEKKKNKFEAELNADRIEDHYLNIIKSNEVEGAYRFIAKDNNNSNFYGNSGPIVDINVTTSNDDAEVNGVFQGTITDATITKSDGSEVNLANTSFNVTIGNPVAVTGITLSETTAAMIVGGDALTLTATITPANATDKAVTWTTSDPAVATVADGVVTAVALGTTTITATATNGTDATSDDKMATCTINVVPTYEITMKEGTADSANWVATPNPAEESKTVTLKYDGVMKVKSVKARKKAPAFPLLSAATAADLGKVVCADGHLHDAKTAVPEGCTAVGILGKVTETGHGLILALKDAKSQTWNTINGWTSVTTYAGTTLKVLPDDAARGTNLTSYTTLGSTAVSNWAVAQKDDYVAIFTNLGSTASNANGKTYDSNVNAYIKTGAGGNLISGTYWSATQNNSNSAWAFYYAGWGNGQKTNNYNVRPVLGF